jgi:hypothetical protein
MLMNSQFILDQAARFAQRLQKEASDNQAQQVTLAWQLAFSRAPTDSELADALVLLSRQVDFLKKAVETKPAEKKDEKAKTPAKPAPELQALTDLCQVLLSANEFLYVD